MNQAMDEFLKRSQCGDSDLVLQTAHLLAQEHENVCVYGGFLIVVIYFVIPKLLMLFYLLLFINKQLKKLALPYILNDMNLQLLTDHLVHIRNHILHNFLCHYSISWMVKNCLEYLY